MSDEVQIRETRGSETRPEEPKATDDGQPGYRERTPGERLAYKQGYLAALAQIARDVDRQRSAAELMLEKSVNL